jgi:hypothetical protein
MAENGQKGALRTKCFAALPWLGSDYLTPLKGAVDTRQGIKRLDPVCSSGLRVTLPSDSVILD